MSTTPTTPPRRSQAQRSLATREALLDATIACLVEDGYANLTTARVAERAGLSRGAHLHHFQTRQALVAAAAERLTLLRSESMLAAAAKLPDGGRARLVQGLDLLWSTYADSLYQAALDLWSDARTDPELRALLGDVERLLDRETIEITRRVFPEQAATKDFERLIEFALATARGLALLDTIHPRGTRNRKQWTYCRERLVELFEAAVTAA